MTAGYCRRCNKLVQIRYKNRNTGRQAIAIGDWVTVEHDDGERRCPGSGKSVL